MDRSGFAMSGYIKSEALLLGLSDFAFPWVLIATLIPFLLLGLSDFAFPWVLIATLIPFLRVPQIVEPAKHGSLH